MCTDQNMISTHLIRNHLIRNHDACNHFFAPLIWRQIAIQICRFTEASERRSVRIESLEVPMPIIIPIPLRPNPDHPYMAIPRLHQCQNFRMPECQNSRISRISLGFGRSCMAMAVPLLRQAMPLARKIPLARKMPRNNDPLLPLSQSTKNEFEGRRYYRRFRCLECSRTRQQQSVQNLGLRKSDRESMIPAPVVG